MSTARNSQRTVVAEGRRGRAVAKKPSAVAGTARSGRFEGRSGSERSTATPSARSCQTPPCILPFASTRNRTVPDTLAPPSRSPASPSSRTLHAAAGAGIVRTPSAVACRPTSRYWLPLRFRIRFATRITNVAGKSPPKPTSDALFSLRLAGERLRNLKTWSRQGSLPAATLLAQYTHGKRFARLGYMVNA